ncbi:4811_t:CDS:2, partial [Racocetra fulgida]
LYNPNTKIDISYDDPQSLYVKAKYTKQQGLKGIAVWEIANDNGQELLNSIQILNHNIPSPTNESLSGPAIAGITLGLATLLSIAAFVYTWYKIKNAAVV